MVPESTGIHGFEVHDAGDGEDDDDCYYYLSGAVIIGVNCKFDPSMSLETVLLMKEALEKEGLSCHLMIQPVGYHTPDAGRTGFSSLPETPFGKGTLDFSAS